MRGRAVAARRAHNPEVLGSNPSPATMKKALHEEPFSFNSLRSKLYTRSPLVLNLIHG